MKEVNIIASITKESWKLIKNGEATLEKGGVKVNGKFKELLTPTLSKVAKTTLNTTSSGILSGLNIASSVGCNIQCGFIQNSINQSNTKIDVILNKLSDLSCAVGKLKQIQTLSWIGNAVGIANLGISLAGFYITSDRLNTLDKKIEDINSNVKCIQTMIQTIEINHDIKEFHEYIMNIKADIKELQDFSSVLNNSRDIRLMLNKISIFLDKMIDDFGKNIEFNNLYCNMIFTLSALFVHEVNIFSLRYYYEKDYFPENYDSWIKVIGKLNSEKFQSKLKKYMIFEFPRVPLNNRNKYFQYAVSLTNNQAFCLDYNYNLGHALALEDLMNIDKYITTRILQTKYPILLEDGSYAF